MGTYHNKNGVVTGFIRSEAVKLQCAFLYVAVLPRQILLGRIV